MLRGLEHFATFKASRGLCSSELRKTVRDSGGASHSKRVKVLKRQQRCHAQADGGTTDATGAGRFSGGRNQFGQRAIILLFLTVR